MVSLNRWVPFVCWLVLFISGLMLTYQMVNVSKENGKLTEQLSAYEILYKVTQSAITLHYQVSLDNIKAKQLEDSEHVNVKTVIKTVLKDNECANTAVPDDVVSELRKYAAEINTRSARADTRTSHR